MTTTWDETSTDPAQRDRSSETWVERRSWRGLDVVAKSATGRSRARLRRESELLQRLQQPGLVQPVELVDSDDRSVLFTRDAGRRTLAHPAGLRGDELIRSLRGCVTTVVQLHAEGWSHGGLRPEHVVVGPRGRARLCSLGESAPIDATGRDHDGARLLDLIEHVARLHPLETSTAARRRWRRRRRHLLRLAAARRAGDGTVTPDDLLDDLAQLDPATPRWRRRSGAALGALRARAVPALLVATIFGAGALVLARPLLAGAPIGGASTSASASSTSPLTAPDRAAPPGCEGWPTAAPDIDGDGCGDRVRIDANLLVVDGATYRVGLAGDRVALADWDCDGQITAVLLRPSTGEVFDFPVWASEGQPTDGQLLATVTGATGLSSTPRPSTFAPDDPGARSCDQVLVALTDGTEVDPLPPPRRDPP